MPICQYFLRGSCRFGFRCKNEHIHYEQRRNKVDNEPQTKQSDCDGVSIMRRNNQNSTESSVNYFSRHQNEVSTSTIENTSRDPCRFTYHNPYVYKKQPEHSKSKHDPKDLLNLAVEDMKGKQWPLTCYAITSSSGNIPGWEDYSPEELRWETVIALQNGTFEGMKLKTKTLYDNAEILKNIFKTPNVNAYELIKQGIHLKQENLSSPIQSQLPVNSFFVNNVTGNPTDITTNFTFSLAAGNETGLFPHPSSEELSQNLMESNREFFHTLSPVMFGTKQVAEIEYSSKQNLTHKEVEAYEDSTFTFGLIPTNPPPREFCNNYPR